MSETVRILQIDNDPTFYDLSRDVLGSEFLIETASSYDFGMALLKTKAYDLVLVNLNLSDRSNDQFGCKILEHIRDNLPDTPRIVITGAPFRGSIFGEFGDRYKVTDVIKKKEFEDFSLRDAVNRALNKKKLSISARLRHKRLCRYVAHYYQKEAIESFPKLQMIEIQVDNPLPEEVEISITFIKQPPYIQETVQKFNIPPGRSLLSISPVFTGFLESVNSIAINFHIKQNNRIIWEPESSMIVDVVETLPIMLKQVATGDQWMHFLVMSCITPRSEEVTNLSGEVRNQWSMEHPGVKWAASTYTQQNALDIARILRCLLQERLTLEGVYIPSIPEGLDIVEHTMRLPDDILKNRGANCLCYSLLYASVLENLGIKPVLLFMPGHVIPGWKKHSSCNIDIRIIKDPKKRYIINEECTFLESTATSLAEFSFDHLLETGKRISANAQELYLRDEQPVSISVVDVADYRSRGLQPYILSF